MSRDSSQKYVSISPETAYELISSGQARVFDVRTPPEYESHRIPVAHLLPIQELNIRHGEIPRESEQKILIICEHGIRSVAACRALSDAGWQNIVNVSGGMAEWLDVGLPFIGINAPKDNNPDSNPREQSQK